MRLEIKEKTAVLHTKPTPAILAILPQLEGRRSWLKSGGLSVPNSQHNLMILKTLYGVIVDAPIDDELLKEICDEEGFDNKKFGSWENESGPIYKPLLELYPHQNRGLERSRERNIMGLFQEQGTGKTAVALTRAGELFLSGDITGVLIVTVKGVHNQWIESEFPKHYSLPFTGHSWNTKGLSDFIEDKEKIIDGIPNALYADGEELKALSFNYDGIKSKKGSIVVKEFCLAHQGKLLIIADESQCIKNFRSARSKKMMELKPYSSHRMLLTGTPIAKDLTDEWAQMMFLDESIIGVRYVTSFKREFCIMGGFEGRQVIGHKNISRFKKLVDPYTFRATKDEIGILPKQYSKWKFELNTMQRRIAKELKDDFMSTLESGEVATIANAISFMVRFQQISSGFIGLEDGKVERLMDLNKNPRLNSAKEWLDSFEGKAIVWARFKEDIRMMDEYLGENNSIVTYYGDTKDKDRKKAIDSWMSDEGARVLIANPQSAGTGLNLQGKCTNALYYSNSFNYVDRVQSEDRIHRIGTNGAVNYTDLIAKGSVDMRILSNLQGKKNLSQLALGDIQQMINEVITL